MARLREQLRPGRSFMLTYNVTPLEKLLSEQLQIPLFGTDPALQWWGTKAGARDLFQRLAIPHPPGALWFTTWPAWRRPARISGNACNR